MAIKIGTIVRSERGHDSGSYYVVVDKRDKFVYIADGRRRKLIAPKAKNPKHLAHTKTVVTLDDQLTDKKLRQMLHSINFGVPANNPEESD